MGGKWLIFPKKGDDSDFDLCTADSVGWTAALDSVEKRPWPPSFKAQQSVFGKKGCRYTGNEDGPGKFSCDSVSEVECAKDPFYDVEKARKYCGSGSSLSTFAPKVVCQFSSQ